MDITINPRAPDSPSRQIAAWVRTQIQDGAIAPGDPIPSVKEFRVATGCAATTICRAVEQLRADGTVFTRRGRGTYAATRS